MSTRLILGMLAAIAAFGTTAPAVDAQEAVAEVRTWGGQSWTLREPTFEIFYTLISPKAEPSAGPPARQCFVLAPAMAELARHLLAHRSAVTPPSQ